MDLSILLVLVQDGVVNGAIYGLLALALVIVFTVTRVILVPIGEFVSFGALTLAALEAGTLPGTVWLLLILGAASAACRLWASAAMPRRSPSRCSSAHRCCCRWWWPRWPGQAWPGKRRCWPRSSWPWPS
ncbi:hypothetical protein ACFQU7_02385 [Pseudoroseomonas wenyumeiae]